MGGDLRPTRCACQRGFHTKCMVELTRGKQCLICCPVCEQVWGSEALHVIATSLKNTGDRANASLVNLVRLFWEGKHEQCIPLIDAIDDCHNDMTLDIAVSVFGTLQHFERAWAYVDRITDKEKRVSTEVRLLMLGKDYEKTLWLIGTIATPTTETLMLKGIALLNLGRYEMALEVFESLLRTDGVLPCAEKTLRTKYCMLLAYKALDDPRYAVLLGECVARSAYLGRENPTRQDILKLTRE